MKKYHIAILDDHQLFIDGLKMILSKKENYKVVATFNQGEDLLSYLKKETIDILISDLQLKGIDGVEVTRKVKANYPLTRVLILSMYSHVSFIKKLLRIGIEGYILKEDTQSEILNALNTITTGNQYISEGVSQVLVSQLSSSNNQSGLNQIRLTKREFEVLSLVSEGLTTGEISTKLFVASSTIISHRKNIMKKLEVKNGAEMVRLATEMGLLS